MDRRVALDARPLHLENEQIDESDPVFGELVLLRRDLPALKVLHRFSRELALHAVGDVGRLLSDALVLRIANATDRAMLVGDGAGGTMLGMANWSGVQVIAAVGAPSVAVLHDAVGRLLSANASPESAVWFMHPDVLTSLRKAEPDLLYPDATEAGAFRLLGLPVLVTTQFPVTAGATTVLLADVSQVAVARDRDMDVTLLTERYADYDQIGIRVVSRWDVGPLNAAAVVKLEGVTP